VLDIVASNSLHSSSIRDQLVESLPNMNTWEHLRCDVGVFALYISQHRAKFLGALEQNTSIVKLTLCDYHNGDYLHQTWRDNQLVYPVLNRSQCLKFADALMALQPRTRMPLHAKSGIWAMAFARMAAAAATDNQDDSIRVSVDVFQNLAEAAVYFWKNSYDRQQ
jgi:hypothetical protein